MTLRFRALAIATPDPTAAARFWAELLDRDVVEDRDGLLLPGGATQAGLGFEADPAAVTHRNRCTCT